MGQFAAMGISYAAEKESKKKLYRAITLNEFNFACKILSSSTSTTLTMGEFILMEFIRLGCINADQIDTIKDTMNNGELSLEDLFQSNAIVLDKHSVREGIHNVDSAIAILKKASTRRIKVDLTSEKDDVESRGEQGCDKEGDGDGDGDESYRSGQQCGGPGGGLLPT
eukprot:gene28308-37239_t